MPIRFGVFSYVRRQGGSKLVCGIYVSPYGRRPKNDAAARGRSDVQSGSRARQRAGAVG